MKIVFVGIERHSGDVASVCGEKQVLIHILRVW